MEKIRRAIGTIERMIDDSGIYGNPTLTQEAAEDLLLAKKTLKKQIPREPINRSDSVWICRACPECYEIVGLIDKRNDTGGFIYPACKCGQVIDWSVIHDE